MRVLLFIILAVVVGCSRSSHTRTEVAAPRTAATAALDEGKVIAIARQAVATNDTWVTRAEFETPRHDGSGWSVLVWRLPKTPGGHRVILIDRTGRVTEYLRGY